jgi:glycosyltransferase involved in cell wall biosynthesis
VPPEKQGASTPEIGPQVASKKTSPSSLLISDVKGSSRRIRVAHLSSPNTSGTITAKYAQALIEAGADVRIFASNAARVQELKNGAVPTRAPVVVLPFGKRALARPQYYRGRLQLLFMGADVVIAEDPDLLSFAAPYARLTGARLVYMPFEYYPGASYATKELERRWLDIERRCSSAVSSWVIAGDKIAELYAGILAPPESVHVVYNGSPRNHTGGAPKLRRALGLGPEAKILLYQGSVKAKRGLTDVLEAMPLLPPHVHFAVLGMGELDELRQDAAARGLTGRVHVLDAVPQAELVDYTKDADVGLIPIRNICVSYDLCNPGKLFEYLGSGLPLAVSRLSQLEWFVTRHGLGEVFDLESPPALARAVLRLIQDDVYRESCRERCRQLQETTVCWEVQAEKLRRAVLGPSDPAAKSLRAGAEVTRTEASLAIPDRGRVS